MEPERIDLQQEVHKQAGTERILARLAGEVEDEAVKLWGEEFAASGGGKSPTNPPPITSKP